MDVSRESVCMYHKRLVQNAKTSVTNVHHTRLLAGDVDGYMLGLDEKVMCLFLANLLTELTVHACS